MNQSRRRYLFLALLSVSLTAGCTGPSRYGASVDSVLEAAGENRPELQRVLEHFEQQGDSLKFQAALYLIGNMQKHSYVTYYLHDTTDTEIGFDIRDYADYKALKASFDSLEDQHGVLDFDRQEPLYDMHTITADFLIGQIDYAFRAWREKPWARNLSFEDFRQYVLPYRGSNEPLEEWRETFWNKYRDLETQMSDPADPIEAAALINRDIMTWFGFDPRYYYHPTDQGLSEMLANRLGRCEDMTNLAIFALRANGIGVTSDYTPHWANTGNNHAWNAIVTASGEVIPFMGAEADPGEYRLANKLAKAYRKTFGEQKQNLVFQEKKQEKVPRWLGGKYYQDVTADYTDVCDVAVKFSQDIPDSVDIAYLCVFNSGEWKAIHWGRIAERQAVFAGMGKDIAYLPALYLNEEIVPCGPPFILHEDCSQTILRASSQAGVSVDLISTTRRK